MSPLARDVEDDLPGPVRGAAAWLRTRLAPLEGPYTFGSGLRFWIPFAVAALGLLAMPMLNASALPTLYYLLFPTFVALSLAVVWGFTGILSFGQTVFYGLSGYAFAVVALNFVSPLGRLAGLFVGPVIGGLAALVLGYFMFYGGVRDVYVTIITLVSTLILYTYVRTTAGQTAIGSAKLGGFNGMQIATDLTFGVGGTAIDLYVYGNRYTLLVGTLLVTYLALRRLLNSDFGRVMVAVREDEDRAEMLGYDVRKVKLLVFTLGGVLAGVGGIFYATYGWSLQPDPVFGVAFAAMPVVWVSVGGRKTLLGPLVATVGLRWLQDALAQNYASLALVLIGALMTATILVLPDGVLPALARALKRARREGVAAITDRDGAATPTEVTDR